MAVESGTWNRPTQFIGPRPGWLIEDAPHGDVCLSSRMRLMRNLVGHKFPHSSEPAELKAICDQLCGAIPKSRYKTIRGLGPAERDALVAGRLVSPDFPYAEPGRAVALDPTRTVCFMINEEDHLRVQALTGGWSPSRAHELGSAALATLAGLDYAYSPRFGYLSASPFNCGDGVRLSSMLHLVAMATSKRLPRMIEALASMGVTARGLFGESSRAIGAFLQISVVTDSASALIGAGEALIHEELAERERLGVDQLESKARQAMQSGIMARMLSMADALRILGWLRWGACAKLDGFPSSPKLADERFAQLDFRTGADPHRASKDRAVALRSFIESSPRKGH